MNAWFDRSVEPDPQDPTRLANRWYAVVNDGAIVLGDVLVERNPGLRWELFTGGQKDVAHQKHVIVGFSKALNPRYHVDVDRLVAGHATRVVTKDLPTRRNEFTTLLTAARERA